MAQWREALATQACQCEFSLWNLHFKRTWLSVVAYILNSSTPEVEEGESVSLRQDWPP